MRAIPNVNSMPLMTKRDAGLPRVLANETGPIMNVLRFVRSRFNAAYALGVILLGAVALTALQSLVPGEELTTLRSFIPGATPLFELLLFGWIGVAIGRFSVGATSSAGQRDGQRDDAAGDGRRGGEDRSDFAPNHKGAPDALGRQRDLFQAA